MSLIYLVNLPIACRQSCKDASNRHFSPGQADFCFPFYYSAAIPELGGVHLAPENAGYSSLVENAEVMDETLTPEVTAAIWNLWQDPAVRHCVTRSREFQLNDSAP
jgi:hypothetical protein